MWTNIFEFKSLVTVYTRYVELSVMNLVHCFKCQKFGYKQTSCRLDVKYLKCGGKAHSDAIFQRPCAI